MPRTNATVIASYGHRIRLRLDDSSEIDARPKGKRLRVVCGDRVAAEALPGESDWLVSHVGDRRNSLTRPSSRGDTEILAANIDLVFVVTAAIPVPDWFIVDRYLCAAANMAADATVVFNKIDQQAPDDTLREFAGIGYPAIACSAKTGQGIDAIRGSLDKRTAIFVGQSGVGKSSIINCLAEGDSQRIGAISRKSREGRHTTANAIMLAASGGAVIDSPGVRDYAPALSSAADVIRGFRDIEKCGHHCRFANCRHLREPGCEVKAAVERGDILRRRYDSYKRCVNLLARRPG